MDTNTVEKVWDGLNQTHPMIWDDPTRIHPMVWDEEDGLFLPLPSFTDWLIRKTLLRIRHENLQPGEASIVIQDVFQRERLANQAFLVRQ